MSGLALRSTWWKFVALIAVAGATAVFAVSVATAATQTVVITFDDPDGVYLPGDVTEQGFRVWTDDAFKFGIANWDGAYDPDNEINLGNFAKTIKIAAVDGSLFALTSFQAGACNSARVPIAVRGYDADGVLVVTASVADAFPYTSAQTVATFDATWTNLSRVELQSGNAGGCGNNHVIDDITVEIEVPDPSNTKADILSGSGVPGKGLADAPGLQKEFNPNSRAAENAGKK